MNNFTKTKNMKYTVDYFIAKFQVIPDKLWITNRLIRKRVFLPTKCCAQGFCLTPEQRKGVNAGGTHVSVNPFQLQEVVELAELFGGSLRVSHINNGVDPRYQQPTPKLRILAALQDIKAKQEDAENEMMKKFIKDNDMPSPKEVHYVKLEVELVEANPN